jgi:hypothetical protein
MPEGPGAPFLARFRANTKSSNEKSVVISSGGKAGAVKQASAGATRGGAGARGPLEGVGVEEQEAYSAPSPSGPDVDELNEGVLPVDASEKLH